MNLRSKITGENFMKIFILIMTFAFYSCIKKSTEENSTSHAQSISTIQYQNNQLVIKGTNLGDVNKVNIIGNSINAELAIVSVSSNQIIAEAASNFSLAAKALYSLALTDAIGGTTYSISFDLPAGTISGSGTANYIPYYTAASTIAKSNIYVDSTSKNVGIGTSSPSSELHLVGTQTFAESGGTSSTIAQVSSGYDVLRFSNSSIGTYSGFEFYNDTFGSGMLITTTGDVGIGTTNPDSKLEVHGNIVTPTNKVTGYEIITRNSNVHELSNVGQSSISLLGRYNGANLTVIVKDTTSRTYTFAGCTNSFYSPTNAATTAGTRSVYNIVMVQNGANFDCYITWKSGYL